MTRVVIWGLVLGGATLGVLIVAALTSFRHDCEVCISFHGRTVCRQAAGGSREEATRTATDNACAFLASGMTEVVSCSGTPPVSVTCSGD